MDEPLASTDHLSPYDHSAIHPIPTHTEHPRPHPHSQAVQEAEQRQAARHPHQARKFSSSSFSTPPPPPSDSKTSCCTFLHFLLFMRSVAAVSLITIAAVTCEAIHQTITHKPVSSPPDFFTAVLALIFHLLTAIVLVLALARITFILSRIPLLSSFFFLGGAQCYLAVVVLSNTTVEGRFDEWLVDVMRVVCGVLFVVGVMFAVLECVGGKGLERKMRLEEAEEQRRRDLEEV